MIETIKKEYHTYSVYTPPVQQGAVPEKIKQQETSAINYNENHHYMNYINEVEADQPSIVEAALQDEEHIDSLTKQGYLFDVLTKEEGEEALYASLRASEEQGPFVNGKEEKKQIQLQSKIKRIQEKLDSMYIYAMKKDGKLSINDFYKGSFSGEQTGKKTDYTSQDVIGLLDKNGLEKSQGNQAAVDKLLQLGLEVSKTDVLKIQNIEAAIDGLDQYTDYDRSADSPLMEDEKILYSEKDINQIIDELTQVKDETLVEVIGSGEVTIGNIREHMHKNTQKVLDKKMDLAKGVSSEALKEEVSNVKNYLKEIRAKLNVEAARKLSEKMPLESSQLVEVAKELEQMAHQQVETAMEQVELESTPQNKEAMLNIMETVHQMARHKSVTVEMHLESDENITIEECGKVLRAYEEHFSVPEARFKEGVHKVEIQIQSFLENHGLDQVASTEAAKALIASGMELSQVNLEVAQNVVTQLNAFIEEMTPHFVAQLLKDGFNPYKASIAQVLDEASQRRMPQLKESVARSILSLEEKGKINEVQKQEMIGLYRILSQVEKSKDEVSGYLIKNGLALTMEKLEEATKYVGKEQIIDQKIDENSGEIEELIYEKETAKQKIQKGQAYNERLNQIAKALTTMELPVHEENIEKVGKLNAILYAFLKENIKKSLGKFEGFDLLPSHLKEKIEVAKGATQELIATMQEKKIPVTIDHLYWMQKSKEDPELFKQMMMNQDFEENEGFPKSFTELQNREEEAEKKLQEQASQAVENGDLTKYKMDKQVEEVMKMNKQFQDKEGIYHIPFVIEGETKLVQLYMDQEKIRSKSKDEGLEIVISYDTKNMGTLVTKLRLKEEEISYMIKAQTSQAKRILHEEKEVLAKELDEMGYTVAHNTYSEEPSMQSVHPMTIKHIESSFEQII